MLQLPITDKDMKRTKEKKAEVLKKLSELEDNITVDHIRKALDIIEETNINCNDAMLITLEQYKAILNNKNFQNEK